MELLEVADKKPRLIHWLCWLDELVLMVEMFELVGPAGGTERQAATLLVSGLWEEGDWVGLESGSLEEGSRWKWGVGILDGVVVVVGFVEGNGVLRTGGGGGGGGGERGVCGGRMVEVVGLISRTVLLYGGGGGIEFQNCAACRLSFHGGVVRRCSCLPDSSDG